MLCSTRYFNYLIFNNHSHFIVHVLDDLDRSISSLFRVEPALRWMHCPYFPPNTPHN